MVKRTTFLAAWVCIATAAATFGQSLQGTGFLFQLPGQGSSSSRAIAYIADRATMNADVDVTGPVGTFRVIPTPGGTKFYLLNSGSLQALDATLQSFRSINGVTGTVRSAEVTTDGKYLIVLADTIYILNTTTDAIVASGLGLTQNIDAVTTDPTATFLYVATESSFSGTLTKISLANFQKVGTTLALPYVSSALTFSPTGSLYAVFTNLLLEINADTMTTVTGGQYQFSAVPGPVRFTPSGNIAYFANQTPTGPGRVALDKIDFKNHTVNEWPPFNQNQFPPLLDDVYVVGEDRVLTYSPETKLVYDVTSTTFNVVESSLHPDVLPRNQILGFAISNEIPTARFAYALVLSGTSPSIFRVDLSNNTVSTLVAAPTSQGKLQYASVPPQTGAATFLLTNADQTLAAGATSLPLTALVLDGLGRAVFNQSVVYSTDPANGVVINNPTQTTNANGRVSTTAVVPTAPGTYLITVTAGTATTNFRLTIPGADGSTGGGGAALISIVNGDGQIINELGRTANWAPLTVKVVDAAGVPRVGVPVQFTQVEGNGGLNNPNATTDENGLASTAFFSPPVTPTGQNFLSLTIRATSDTGSVDFKEIAIRLPDYNTPGVEFTVLTPNPLVINAPQGEIVPNAVTIRATELATPNIGAPIPNFTLRTGDASDVTKAGPGACVGPTRSDSLGVAHCDFQSSCTIGSFEGSIVIGEYFAKPFIFNIVPGKAAKLILGNGDAQSGNAGQTLQNLTATVTDGCGKPISGATVSMTVLSGSATVTPINAVSDGNGNVSAKVVLGSTPGPVQVQFAITGKTPIVFNLTNSVVVGTLGVNGGTGQSALIGQQFTTPVSFILKDSTGKAIPNALVNFTVSGPGTISPASGSTATDGTVQTSVTAGSSTGTITVTATYATFSNFITLQVRPVGPQISSTTFFNAASLAVGLTPCGLATAVANGLAPTVQGVVSGVGFGPMPYSLAGIDSIFVNNVPAPIQSVANVNGRQQVTFQTPCETSVGAATVRVKVSGTESTATGVPVLQAQPGIFTFAGPNNISYGAVIRIKDGTYITPSNFAPVGEHFYLVVTGLGQTNPGSTTNSSGTGNVITPVVVGVNNAGMAVDSARPLAGYTGVYLVEFEIPLTAKQGPDQALAAYVTINGQIVFGNGVYIPGVGPAR